MVTEILADAAVRSAAVVKVRSKQETIGVDCVVEPPAVSDGIVTVFAWILLTVVAPALSTDRSPLIATSVATFDTLPTKMCAEASDADNTEWHAPSAPRCCVPEHEVNIATTPAAFSAACFALKV